LHIQKGQIMEETAVDSIAMSPVPSSKKDELQGKVLVDFYQALKAVSEGKKATRLDWRDSDVYMFLRAEVLHIKRVIPDNTFTEHKMIINLGDMIADDWIILG